MTSFRFAENLQNMKNVCTAVLHFSLFDASISLQRKVVRPSDFQLYRFVKSLSLNYWAFIFDILFMLPCTMRIFNFEHI